jgi:hypothetical protein
MSSGHWPDPGGGLDKDLYGRDEPIIGRLINPAKGSPQLSKLNLVKLC